MTAHDNAEADEAPRPLNAKDRRIIAGVIAAMILLGYAVIQLLGVWNAKDVAPPAWAITAPAGATIVGEPVISREPYRATTYVTIRPAEGHSYDDLVAEMRLSEQPTQIGPTPLDWRPVWVYSRPGAGGVEFRLEYLRDSEDLFTP